MISIALGFFKNHLCGERFAAYADVKQAVALLKVRDTFSSTPMYKPRCHGGTDAETSKMTTWEFDVYHLLSCAVYTSKSE